MDGQAKRDVFPYWLVWCKRTPWMPRYRHPSEESARAEAKRLAGVRGQRFYVVRVEGVIGEDVIDEAV